MLNQEVRKIMTTNPVVASPSNSMQELKDLMEKYRIQQIPVVDEGEFKGIVTSFDLWKNHEKNQESTTVDEIMSRQVIKITPIDKVGTAAELFMDKRFKTLPVVNLNNELKGVVTAFDVMKHVLKKEYPNPILYKEVLAS